MKLWLQVILEWLNCLDILETNVKDLKELEDGKFYKKLIELLSRKDAKDILNTKNIVRNFLQGEYPEFKFNDELTGEVEHMYIASLFLLHTSQEPLFHQPMCNKLQHETQVKIKSYLEMIIPYGKGINRETLKRVITELEDDAPKTPVTPGMLSLKDFFNSPAARSAQSYKLLSSKYRELRKLKADLEVERFEKADLQEDLKIQQKKVLNLQKKLQEKTAEIKAIQEERMKQNTPQSCKKNTSTVDYERQYRREIDHLENQLIQKQCEIDKLETDNGTLSKKLTCVEKQCIYFREKIVSFEKSIENLQIQGEIKDRELLNLRMSNEELQMHLKEFTKMGVEEQSFEIDGVLPLNLTISPLNNSEALSSVIEIQLQEAKEESASLKTQLNTLNKKLDSTSQEYENVTQLLKEKTLILQDTETKLNTALNKLTEEVESLKEEKTSVINKNKDLEDLCNSQKKSLSQFEEAKNILSTEVVTLREKVKSIEETLHEANENNVKLNTALTETKLELQKNVECTQDLTRQNNLYKTSIENCNKNLKKIILHHSKTNDIENNNLNDVTAIQLVECLQALLHNFDKRYVSKRMEVESLNSVIKEMKLKEQDYQSEISELEKKYKQNIIDISKLEETIALNTTKINELTTTIHQYSEEISYLKQIEIEKQALEKDMNILKEEVSEKDLLLNSSKTGIKILKDNLQTFVTEFHLTKKDVLNQLNECQKQNTETIKNTLNAYEKMYNNFSEEQLSRKTMEDKLADNEKKLKDSQNLNTTLENNLRKNELIISDLERELISTKEKVVESVQKLEKLEETKETLEKHHKNLKSQNEKILLDLNIINDKLKLSQQETYNMSDQLKFKDDKIGNLIAEISSLKLEKEQIIHVQIDEESKMKNCIKILETKLLEKQHCWDQLNIETKLKQETLQFVQNKFEKLSEEAIASEMKMKEVIMNLQEVRTNQDAVLTTQEKALKEKDLHIQQLQKEFSELKGALCKQLEDEKLLRHNVQSTNSELQIQSYKQMKTINELQEVLKRERNELNKSKEYCKAEDSKKLEIARACEKLEHSASNLKITIVGACPENEHFYADVYNPTCTSKDDESDNILNIIRSSINEMYASRELILYLSNINTNLNETLHNQKAIVDNYVIKCEEIKSLNNEVQKLKNVEEKHRKHLSNLIKHKESLRDYLQDIKKSREGLDVLLSEIKEKWDRLLTKSHYIFTTDKSICDELKHIQAKKIHLENTLFKYNIYHLQNVKPLQTILWQKFLWTEERLKDTYLNPTNNQQNLDISLDDFSDERTLIKEELEKNITLKQDIISSQNEVDKFSSLVASFESNFNSDEMKFQSEAEKKLQLQINGLIEEKNDIGSKLDCARLKNAKLEGHIDELRNKIKELEIASSKETESLKKEILQSKEEIVKLQEEKNELNKRPKKEDVDNQLKEVHDKYKIKYDEIKQNMKTAYNEQITKLNREQEQCVQERLESLQRRMELQCRKQADELGKYKSHVADMSSQLWNVGEKLLSERQEKEKLQKELMELKAKYQSLDKQIVSSTEHKSSKYERRHLLPGENKEEVLHKVAIIQEKTTYEKRCSIRSIQTMGNAFNAEDEEGEVFDNTYLADMKDGHSSLSIEPDRVSILQQRNALCKPHLKSSYPAEMQFHPLPFTEEEIKLGSATDDVFNDSLSQSLLPEQKTKKRDRTQTSYKKPGPPTPSKNGGRLSLQGNELKSPNSRILRERNKDRATTTPRTLKSLFCSKRHDENVVITPRGRRRSSIFRKYRTNDR